MAFRVGMKVVCIKRGKWMYGCGNEINPVFGQVYTIREIDEFAHDGIIDLKFEEIHNIHQHYSEGYMECGFWSIHFRPVKTTSTGIALLNHLLLPKPAKRARQRV